jgi:hypothetical protein
LSSLPQIQGQRSRTPVPLVNIVEPDVVNDDDDDNNNNNEEGTVLRGGRKDKRMGFQGGCEEEKGDGGQFDGAGGQGGGMANLQRLLFCIVVGVLLHTQEINIKTRHAQESVTL